MFSQNEGCTRQGQPKHEHHQRTNGAIKNIIIAHVVYIVSKASCQDKPEQPTSDVQAPAVPHGSAHSNRCSRYSSIKKTNAMQMAAGIAKIAHQNQSGTGIGVIAIPAARTPAPPQSKKEPPPRAAAYFPVKTSDTSRLCSIVWSVSTDKCAA